jgi:hypothetical protein
MKTFRIIAIIMFALLYLGGMVAHFCGAAFPIVGTGDEVLDHFAGKSADPVRPTIMVYRHLPLVKSFDPPPVFAIVQHVFYATTEIRFFVSPSVPPSIRGTYLVICSDRAPPLS